MPKNIMPEKTSQHLFSNTAGCAGGGGTLLHKQSGGGLGAASHAVDRFNHSSSSSYGYDDQGAAVSHELRGSYPAMTKNFDRNYCGGKKKRRKKTKRRRKKTKRRRKKTKRRRKKTKRRRKYNKRLTRYKKSRNKRRRRRRTKRAQKGGASISYSTVNKGLFGNNARILGTHSMTLNQKTCGDNYNHFTRGETKSLY